MTTTLTWNNRVHEDGSTGWMCDTGGQINMPIQITTAGSTATTGNSYVGTWVIYNTSGSCKYTIPYPDHGVYLDVIIASTSPGTTNSPQIAPPSTAATFLNLAGSSTTVFAIATSGGAPSATKIINLIGGSTSLWVVIGSQPTSAWTFSATSS